MKKIQILGIALLCSTFLWTACSKKGADATATTKSVATTSQEAPAAEKPAMVEGRQPAPPPEENLSKQTKGIGVQAQAIDMAVPEEIMEVAPIPEIQMPPLTKAEEEAFRKRILEAQEKQKKKKG
jgi:hypothetical protein